MVKRRSPLSRPWWWLSAALVVLVYAVVFTGSGVQARRAVDLIHALADLLRALPVPALPT